MNAINYAYEQGYDMGWKGLSLKPWPTEVPRTGGVAMWLKAGWVDGSWDREQGHPYRTTQEGPGTDQGDE